MGYAGNEEPQYIVPTVIACQASKVRRFSPVMSLVPRLEQAPMRWCRPARAWREASIGPDWSSAFYGYLQGFEGVRDGLDDLDFFIGDEAMAHATTHQINYPIRHGLVENWDHMERLWQRCIFKVRARNSPNQHASRALPSEG
jgi:actin-related protein 3